ncbi:MAG TPA: hypothetical protein VFD73_22675, partial [Gemmatimonadales bacterium]|nr:hypothetical protein [Gemmatimonadales bacterium]
MRRGWNVVSRRGWILGLIIGLALASTGCAAIGSAVGPSPTVTGPEFIERSQVFSSSACTVERVAYTSSQLKILGWIVTPSGPGPWPLLVFNHGSRVGADLVDHSADPTWQPAFGCSDYLTDNRWMVFLPEGRGYGGSEGPGMGPVLRGELPVMQMLHGRADDVNAGVTQLERQANVR